MSPSPSILEFKNRPINHPESLFWLRGISQGFFQCLKEKAGDWCVCIVFRDDCTNGASYGWSEFSHLKNMFGLVWKVVFLVIMLLKLNQTFKQREFCCLPLSWKRCLLFRHSVSIGKKINKGTRKWHYPLIWFRCDLSGFLLLLLFFCFDLLCFPLKHSFRDFFLYSPFQDIKDLNL